MSERIKYLQSFTGGMNTILSPKLMPSDVYEYMLNCNVFSTADGNVGVVEKIKGNVNIPVPLPDGLNKTIGKALDKEENNLYFFVWNSEGHHGIYRFNLID